MAHRDLATAFLAAVMLTGCTSAAIWGNLAVFALSVGIFVSTLALGQAAEHSALRPSDCPAFFVGVREPGLLRFWPHDEAAHGTGG